ncbi:hypothetical protein GCM10027569_65740 [Flindersiella endophytica]
MLNGGSSSGKSGIVRCLQAILPEPWLATGVDKFVEAMPVAMEGSDAGITISPTGEISVGPDFKRLDAAWREGIAAMARAGAKVIIDEVFLGGGEGRQRWQKSLDGLDVLWVGVHCDPDVAAGRELARGDRTQGMARSQAEIVHKDMVYDVEVDTTHAESLGCAKAIATHVT